MSWHKERAFYHIYPLGLCDAPFYNDQQLQHRLLKLLPWIDHISDMGFKALYIGPLFESMSHGYDTKDYRLLDCRLGDNDDLKHFIEYCHQKDIKVILDAVFNHTGRDFFAFKDILQYRETSWKLGWYNIHFGNNNEYNDGFSYDNWGGHNALVKLNLKNEEVRKYLLETVEYWVDEFDIDGLRLDAADVLDFDFMKELRFLANNIKEDFLLLGEVIHGEYQRWVNDQMLHAITDYPLHKALYSGHNDHNYFEIAHTMKRLADMGLTSPGKLYNFVDNHDVERIINKLNNKKHFLLVHILLFTLPGIPSIYYGSEFAIEGKKQKGSDVSLRPYLDLNECLNNDNYYFDILKKLINFYNLRKSLCYADYKELCLTTSKYAYSRNEIIITLNNDDNLASFDIAIDKAYQALFSDEIVYPDNGNLHIEIAGNDGQIWYPVE